MPTPTRQPPAYSYRAAFRPASHQNQCYYRGSADRLRSHAAACVDDKSVELFRFAQEAHGAELRIETSCSSIRVELPQAELLALRDALNDALIDLAVTQAQALRRASLRAIQDELDEAAADGRGTGVYYTHPDVHYVPNAAAAAAKTSALEAAGCDAYIVLVDPLAPTDATPPEPHAPSVRLAIAELQAAAANAAQQVPA
jgi:hypothetical protein